MLGNKYFLKHCSISKIRDSWQTLSGEGNMESPLSKASDQVVFLSHCLVVSLTHHCLLERKIHSVYCQN